MLTREQVEETWRRAVSTFAEYFTLSTGFIHAASGTMMEATQWSPAKNLLIVK